MHCRTKSCGATVSSCHRILRPPNNAAEFNRRMRKTARPVVWEGDRAYPRSLDLINDFSSLRFFAENYVTLGETACATMHIISLRRWRENPTLL